MPATRGSPSRLRGKASRPASSERRRRVRSGVPPPIRFGFPPKLAALSVADLLAAMRLDKKSLAGRLRFILPRRLGEVALFEDIPENDVRRVLEESLA